MTARNAFVVTGGGRGIGRAIIERLLADGHAVAILEKDADAVSWATGADACHHGAADRLVAVTGDAAERPDAERAMDAAVELGKPAGWVNNAAIFRDASLATSDPVDVLGLITANLAPVVVGSAVAIRRLGVGGSIVNVSSHQAQRAVRGALPYVTAKAAIEGLTRALAVDAGPAGIRVNAVALGSVRTERFDAYRAALDESAAAELDAQMRRLHPLGRVGEAAEVADAVAYLLSDRASFISGAVLPVDGGRAAQGDDPEAAG